MREDGSNFVEHLDIYLKSQHINIIKFQHFYYLKYQQDQIKIRERSLKQDFPKNIIKFYRPSGEVGYV